MPDRELVLALVRDLRAAGVSSAAFSDMGELKAVEFFPSLPTFPTEVGGAGSTEPTDAVTKAALAFTNRGKRDAA